MTTRRKIQHQKDWNENEFYRRLVDNGWEVVVARAITNRARAIHRGLDQYNQELLKHETAA
jgi:hypothetical protein